MTLMMSQKQNELLKRWIDPEIIKMGVVTIDVSSFGTKFENFAGRLQGFRFAP